MTRMRISQASYLSGPERPDDTNAFVYAVGRRHPWRASARRMADETGQEHPELRVTPRSAVATLPLVPMPRRHAHGTRLATG